MINIYVRYLDHKIMGYNKMVNDEYSNPDIISIDGDLEAAYFEKKNCGNNLYFINGEIVEKPETDIEKEIVRLNGEILELTSELDDKTSYTTMMNLIMDGKTLEEAAEIIKEKRTVLSNLKGELKTIIDELAVAEREAKLEHLSKEYGNGKPKYFLTGFTVVRDEEGYIEEWLRYHIEEVGFDHFVIYDNESSVPLDQYLRSINFKHIDKLEIIPWETSENTQEDTNNNYLKVHWFESTWAINFDVDEYIILCDDSKTLKELLSEHPDQPVVRCKWQHFNANGQENKTEGTDMERFTQECEAPKDSMAYGKEIIQPHLIKYYKNHMPFVREIYSDLYEFKEVGLGVLQLNHYITRSYEEYLVKMEKGSVNSTHSRSLSTFFELNPDMEYLNDGEDYEQNYGPNITD